MEDNLSPHCKFEFRGASADLAHSFQSSCETGRALRKGGLDWDAVEEHLAKIGAILFAGGFEGRWKLLPEFELSDDELDSDSEDDDDDDGDDGEDEDEDDEINTDSDEDGHDSDENGIEEIEED